MRLSWKVSLFGAAVAVLAIGQVFSPRPTFDVAAIKPRIGGAGLDVFDHEPLPADSPLWDLDNLLITPHTAATSDKMWERHYALIKENLRRYLAGEPLLGLVDKQVGY